MFDQLNLFQHIESAFAENSKVRNSDLYLAVARKAGIPPEQFNEREPVGKAGQKHNLLKRKIRWYQQDLKHRGLVERVDGERGLWQLTDAGEKKLRKIQSNAAMLAYSTDLGLAIWGDAAHVMRNWDEPITLAITSPPYPLRKQRAYGNPKASEYVDFICTAMEPVVKNLVKGGSVVINVSNDIFDEGMPSRSLYLERLVLALHDRLGLHMMDRLVWSNPSKPPGPIQWASKTRQQLNVGYEMIYWFTNSPMDCKANNRRVLEPHTEKHLKLMKAGEQRSVANSDGAYVLKVGSYAGATDGRIPKNVIMRGHRCPYQAAYKRTARSLGLPVHGAPFPVSLVRFLMEFLTEVDDLIVDNFSGSQTTPEVAEMLGRRWLAVDNIWEYLRGGAERMRKYSGYQLNPMFDQFPEYQERRQWIGSSELMPAMAGQ